MEGWSNWASHTEMWQGMWWATWMRRGFGSANRTPATTSTTPVRQLLGSANAETTRQGTPAAAAIRKQRPDAAHEGKNG